MSMRDDCAHAYLAAEAILREEDVAWLIERVVILRMSPHSGVVVGQPTEVGRYFAGVHQALKAALMNTRAVLSTPPFAQSVGSGKVSYELVVDHSKLVYKYVKYVSKYANGELYAFCERLATYTAQNLPRQQKCEDPGFVDTCG